jgi:hypothetical protein
VVNDGIDENEGENWTNFGSGSQKQYDGISLIY